MLQHLGQRRQLIQTEEGRGASAKVKLREGFAQPKSFGDSGHFLLKSFQVALNQFCITGDDFVAYAKGAKRSAERNVMIDRNPPGLGSFCFQCFGIFPAETSLGPDRNRGITGVAWTGLVVLLHQPFQILFENTLHDRLLNDFRESWWES